MHVKIHGTRLLETQGGENLHKCKHCDKVFTGKSGLSKHEQTHSEEKPHQCQTM